MLDLNKHVHVVNFVTISGEKHLTLINTEDKKIKDPSEVYEYTLKYFSEEEWINSYENRPIITAVRTSTVESFYISKSISKKDAKKIVGEE